MSAETETLSPWGETQDVSRARRKMQSVMVRDLQADLYKRVADPDPDNGMTWESPLAWRVRIYHDFRSLCVEVTDPRGEQFAWYRPETGYELANMLP